MLFTLPGRGMVILSEHMLENYNYWNSINLIPFKTIIEYATAIFEGNIRGHAIRNLFGNLFLFFPAGFYLPFFIQKTSKLKIYSIAIAAFIVAIEIIQFAAKSRSLDIDDFLLNFTGALIGFIVFSKTSLRALHRFRVW
jgi:glycopeptide antibiotics resistance protein